MKLNVVGVLTIVFCISLAAVPTFAHHGFSAWFDSNKQVTLTGVVTQLEWTNPHSHLFLDVKNEKGKVENWAVEAFAPNSMMHAGWTKDMLKPGTTITVFVNPAKPGTALGETMIGSPLAIDRLQSARFATAGCAALADGVKRQFGMGLGPECP